MLVYNANGCFVFLCSSAIPPTSKSLCTRTERHVGHWVENTHAWTAVNVATGRAHILLLAVSATEAVWTLALETIYLFRTISTIKTRIVVQLAFICSAEYNHEWKEKLIFTDIFVSRIQSKWYNCQYHHWSVVPSPNHMAILHMGSDILQISKVWAVIKNCSFG